MRLSRQRLPRLRQLADLPIYAKVCLAPGLILFVLLLLSLASLRMLSSGGERLRAITEQAFPTYQRAAEVKDAVNAIQTALQHTLSVAANENDQGRLRSVAEPVRQAIAAAAPALDRLRGQLEAQHEPMAPAKSFEAYRAAASDVLDTAMTDSATATMLMAEADDQFARLSAELDGYKRRADAASQSLSEEAVRAAAEERVLLLAGLATAIVVCGVIMIATARAIARPIVGLTARMVAMAEDDLDRAIPALQRGDEIGAMARAVDVFRSNGLQARRHRVEREQEQEAKQRHQVAMDQHTRDFGTAIGGVMTSLGGSADAMRRAAAAMAEAAGRVYQQASGTAEGAAKASLDLAAVAAAIEQLTASVAEISRQVASAGSVAREAVQSAGTGQTTMRGLADAASRIGEVVHLISTIAGKTNLLALNATIEAARAGDAGKGFAVVAGEVKTLATQTAKATSDIERLIAAVSGAADASLRAMTDVGAIIGRMDAVAAAIAAAVEQQAVTTRELAGSIQAVSGETDRTAHAMGDVAGVANDAGGVSREVLQAADAIGREAENLRSEVGDFLKTIRGDDQERRRYERVGGNRAPVVVAVAGRAPVHGVLKDLSRGGAALACDLLLAAGAEVNVTLAGADGPVAARAVRSGDGLLVVAFHQDKAALVQLDRALDALAAQRRAA